MRGAFGTDEQGNLRDERDYSEPIEDPRLLQVLRSEERIGYWPKTQLRDFDRQSATAGTPWPYFGAATKPSAGWRPTT